MIHLVLLSGGSGSRLWPLSNTARSKQFLKVLRDDDEMPVSMVQRVISKIRKVNADIKITIATSAMQMSNLESQLDGSYDLVVEPGRRDTAPAIMLACANLAFSQNVSLNETVVVMPIDSYADQDFYGSVIELDRAVQAGFADLMLLGIQPDCASTKYGYIVPQEPSEKYPSSRLRVAAFKEKPNRTVAQELVAGGAFWNCGVFAFRLGFGLNALARYGSFASYEEVRRSYDSLPRVSFDYEVVEKCDSTGVIPFLGRWKDLGTWDALAEEMACPVSGRVAMNEQECPGVHVINETGLPLVVSGIRDSVVVATPDGILVSSKESASGSELKSLISAASESRPMYEQRRWGEYRVLESRVFPDGTKCLTKELVVSPGSQLSYQRHSQRAEIWTVAFGTGCAVLDGHEVPLAPGKVVEIQAGASHALMAFETLRIIEVQLGTAVDEEDIERFGFFWEASSGDRSCE